VDWIDQILFHAEDINLRSGNINTINKHTTPLLDAI